MRFNSECAKRCEARFTRRGEVVYFLRRFALLNIGKYRQISDIMFCRFISKSAVTKRVMALKPPGPNYSRRNFSKYRMTVEKRPVRILEYPPDQDGQLFMIMGATPFADHCALCGS
jgi:hypothetical protein